MSGGHATAPTSGTPIEVQGVLYQWSNPRTQVVVTGAPLSLTEWRFEPAEPADLAVGGVLSRAGASYVITNVWAEHGIQKATVVRQ